MVREVGSSEDGHEGDNRYMAPELLESSLKSPAADMFSFGIMMWAVASRQKPYEATVRTKRRGASS